MKIAFVIQDLFGQGAQYATAVMARGFVKHGYDVDILVSQVHFEKMKEGKNKSFRIPSSVNLIALPSRKARGNILALRKYLKATDAVAVLSTSSPYHICHRLAMMGLRNRRLLNVCMDHGNWGEDITGPILPVRRNLCKGIRQWFEVAAFSRRFFVNEVSRKNFLALYPYYDYNKTAVVYNPVVDDEFYRKMGCAAMHPWLKDKRCYTFVTAGAYQPYKDHMTAMRAIASAQASVRVRLIIYGAGPLEDSYRRYIAENELEDVISIGGYTDNLPAELKAADGYLMTSKKESFGIVIAEALACGLNVISTDAPYGPREILVDGKFGTLVPVADVDALSAAIVMQVRTGKTKVPDEAWNRFTLDAAVERFEKGLGIK